MMRILDHDVKDEEHGSAQTAVASNATGGRVIT